MWRALAKGAVLAAFGHAPSGTALYRRLTRELIGTQATHVDKWIEDGQPLGGAPGLPRALLARRFRAFSDDDLRTAAAHYLFRRR